MLYWNTATKWTLSPTCFISFSILCFPHQKTEFVCDNSKAQNYPQFQGTRPAQINHSNTYHGGTVLPVKNNVFFDKQKM
jgi:hypothetical protein